MKTPSKNTPAIDMDATPQSGGSYIRQPDGSLERVLTVTLPVADQAQPREPVAASSTNTQE